MLLLLVLPLLATMFYVALRPKHAVLAQEPPDIEKTSQVGPYTIPEYVPANYVAELQAVLQQLDAIEQQTLAQAQKLPINNSTRLLQMRTLGKLILYDKSYSVNQNTPCTLCRVKETGFTGLLSDLNQNTVSYPGSVRYRFGSRKPKSYAYSPYSQILHLDQGSQIFYGGNFWDQRASAWKSQNPSSTQAKEPPVDPLEMGFSDGACAVYRLSQAPYLFLYKDLFGSMIDAIKWPSNTAQICSTPTQGLLIQTCRATCRWMT